ncbi:MAG TPA: DUF2723 domain-containing protein [bacterium]|nr:DUF2723 domain-containing protein [bacterium]
MNVLEKTGIWLFFTVCFLVFSSGVCPGIYWGDDGLLITASLTYGLGHAPGHPLYMMINRIALAIPFGDIAFRYNLMSAFWISLAVTVLGMLTRHLWQPLRFRGVVPIACGVFFITHVYMWHQAVRAETYGLHFCILALSLFCILHLDPFRGLPAGAFLAALMLGNQLFLAALAGPGLLWAWFHRWADTNQKQRIFIFSGTVFVLGLSLYVYPWLRSESPGGSLWTILDSSRSHFDYVTARIYRTGFLEGTGADASGSFIDRMIAVLTGLVSASGWMMPILALVGVGRVCVIRRTAEPWFAPGILICLATMTGAACCTNFSADNWDFQGYLLPAIGMLPILAFGAFPLNPESRTRWKQYGPALILIAAILPLRAPESGGYRFLSGRAEPGIAGRCALDGPVPGATVLTRSDFKYVLDYLQYGEKYRNDLRLISRNFIMRNAGRKSLERWMKPWQIPSQEPGSAIHYQAYIAGWLEWNSVFPVSWELADDSIILENSNVILENWFARVNPGKTIGSPTDGRCLELLKRVQGNSGARIRNDANAVEQLYTVFYNRGTFSLNRSQFGDAVRNLQAALMFAPYQAKAQNNLGVALARIGQFDRAAQAFMKVLEIQPDHPGARKNLEAVQKEMGK